MDWDGGGASLVCRDDLLSISPMQRDWELDLVVAGSPEGVIMVINQLPEQDIIEAIDFGHGGTELDPLRERANSRPGIELVQETLPEADNVLNFIHDRAAILLNKSCLNLNKTKRMQL